jgi:hypothetical protein
MWWDAVLGIALAIGGLGLVWLVFHLTKRGSAKDFFDEVMDDTKKRLEAEEEKKIKEAKEKEELDVGKNSGQEEK